ncbi:MAG: DUF3987 domain-containing protein [Steroidobacteraceae bacterium]
MSRSNLANVALQLTNYAPEDKLDWPPGMAGEIAQYIYDSAPRPVKEVAIVASLGLLAGVCGKAWNIPGSGLNGYFILVARSAIGKEQMHTGLSTLVRLVPSLSAFVDFTEFASGPALTKACADTPSFVNVLGEWGRKLRKMAKDDGRDSATASLRTVMTNLYQKSGSNSVMGGLGYSDRDKNIESVMGVAYSMIGETTPSTFYEALTTSMMEDGFISRFTVVEYTGQRPRLNENPQPAPADLLVKLKSLVEWANYGLTNLRRGWPAMPVETDDDAHEIFGSFEDVCDTHINSSDDESYRQMWNRAALKVKRISALLAIGTWPVKPIISLDHATWALTLVRRDIAMYVKREQAGDIGDANDDQKRRQKLFAFLRKYIRGEPPKDASLKMLHENGVVPHRSIIQGLSNQAAFTSHKLGQNEALKATIRDLVDGGYLREAPKDELIKLCGYHGRAYRMLELPQE